MYSLNNVQDYSSVLRSLFVLCTSLCNMKRNAESYRATESQLF